MKSRIQRLSRLVPCLLAGHLVSCSTSSLVGSRTRHVGTIHAIKECRADDHHAYVLFQMEKGSRWETCAIELKARNAVVGRKAPASAKMVPIIELQDEKAALSKGHSSPRLGVWRVHPDKPGSPFAPRVRWAGGDRDFCVNLPSQAAEPGKIGLMIPLAVFQDTFRIGFVSAAVAAETALWPIRAIDDPAALDEPGPIEKLKGVVDEPSR
jgi:hypothetical protein